jgi:hypothetical protein
VSGKKDNSELHSRQSSILKNEVSQPARPQDQSMSVDPYYERYKAAQSNMRRYNNRNAADFLADLRLPGT